MKFSFILVPLMLLSVFACQTAPTSNLPVTVEVTRSVVVTQQSVATVQVPVEVTREVFVPVTAEVIEVAVEAPELGSAENPIQLIFSPIYGSQVTTTRGEQLIDALQASTGLAFDVVALDSSQAAVDAACANLTSISFFTAQEYVIAHEQCDPQIGFAGIRDGINWTASMVMVPEVVENELTTLADLDGKTWGVVSENDFVNTLYWQARFAAQEIEPGTISAYDTDASAVIAGNDNEVEFVTASYLPPILPREQREWVFGEDDPELWRTAGLPFRSGIGFVVVTTYVDQGGWRVRDARAIALDSRQFIFANTDIMLLSEQFPNDAIAFGNQLPIGIVNQISEALSAHSSTESCQATLCSSDFFKWEGIAVVDDSFYDSVRFVIDELGLSAEEIFSYLATSG